MFGCKSSNLARVQSARVSQMLNKKVHALFRRSNLRAELTWMSASDKRDYFKHFLKRFVPDCSDDQWTCWQDSFLSGDRPWASHAQISVDMWKQYLMKVLTDSICHDDWQGCPLDVCVGGEGLQMTEPLRSRFFCTVFNHKRAKIFLGAYTLANQRSETLGSW